MAVLRRTWNLISGSVSRLIFFFEKRNPEALLEREKEHLRNTIKKFNEGLVAHAAMSERIAAGIKSGESERATLAGTVRALIAAGKRDVAAQHALELKRVEARLEADRAQFDDAEAVYQQLLATRDSAVRDARENIEELRRQIGDMRMNEARAELEGIATDMIGDMGVSTDSFERLREVVSEATSEAKGKIRVGQFSADAVDLTSREAEREALEALALEEFEAGETGRALPDFTQEDERVPAKLNQTTVEK